MGSGTSGLICQTSIDKGTPDNMCPGTSRIKVTVPKKLRSKFHGLLEGQKDSFEIVFISKQGLPDGSDKDETEREKEDAFYRGSFVKVIQRLGFSGDFKEKYVMYYVKDNYMRYWSGSEDIIMYVNNGKSYISYINFKSDVFIQFDFCYVYHNCSFIKGAGAHLVDQTNGNTLCKFPLLSTFAYHTSSINQPFRSNA